MKFLSRITIVCLCAALIALAGCKSVIEINNSTDPEDFDTIVLPPSTGLETYYDEVAIDVPDDIRKDDYDITDVDIYADALADTLAAGAVLDVKLYVGLQPGQANLSNTAINEILVSVELVEEGRRVKIAIRNSELIYKAFDQPTFWIKVTVEYNVAVRTVVSVKNVYVDMQIERETSGLLPIFYVF